MLFEGGATFNKPRRHSGPCYRPDRSDGCAGWLVLTHTPTPVGSHLRQSSKDVLHPHSHATDSVVGLPLGWALGMTASGFAHKELLRVELDQMRLVFGAVIGTVAEDSLVLLVE